MGWIRRMNGLDENYEWVVSLGWMRRMNELDENY